MGQDLILIGITLDEFLTRIEQLLDKKFQNVFASEIKGEIKFLSRAEVAKLLKISLPTLCQWSKFGVIPSHKIGRRVLYKQNEVESALQKVGEIKFKKNIL